MKPEAEHSLPLAVSLLIAPKHGRRLSIPVIVALGFFVAPDYEHVIHHVSYSAGSLRVELSRDAILVLPLPYVVNQVGMDLARLEKAHSSFTKAFCAS